MKKILFALPLLLLSGALAGARTIPSGALGTRSYEVRYVNGALNAKVATARISLEKSSWNSQAAYHSNVTIQASSIFRLFMNAEYLVDTYLTLNDQQPLYFINPVKKGGREGKYEYTYRLSEKQIESVTVPVTKDAEPILATFPMDGKTMDLVALLSYVRFLDVSPSTKPQTLNLLMAGKSFPARLVYQGRDSEHVAGKTTDSFLLEMTERGLMENGSGKEIRVWRSTGEDRTLYSLEAALSQGVMSISIKE